MDKPVTMKKNKIDQRTIVKWIILAAAVILLLIGVLTGGFDDVRARAIRICMECIGIG